MAKRRKNIKMKAENRIKKAKGSALMCRAFKHYGFALMGIGIFFFLLNFIYGATQFRNLIVAFFIALGIIDLLLYLKYGEG